MVGHGQLHIYIAVIEAHVDGAQHDMHDIYDTKHAAPFTLGYVYRTTMEQSFFY